MNDKPTATPKRAPRGARKSIADTLRDKALELHHLAGRAMTEGKRELANAISDHASATEKLANTKPAP